MSAEQVQSIVIKGFKGFEDFHLEGLKRVNLIGGKNNIGKTAFMEALRLHLASQDALDVTTAIRTMLLRRQGRLEERDRTEFDLDFFFNGGSSLQIKANDNALILRRQDSIVRLVNNEKRTIEYFHPSELESATDIEQFEISREPGIEVEFKKEKKLFPLQRFILRRGYLSRNDSSDSKARFISSATTDERQIAILYGSLVNVNKEHYLNSSLKLFDESIEALKQVVTDNGVLLKLLTTYQDKPVLLSSFGEGINRYIAVLCAIWASQDGYLFVDEIENGIHYTNYPKLWRLIFEASKLANCQLFISTHSKECIEAFNSQNSDDEGAYFEFYRNQKNDRITAKSRGYEQLDYALSHQGALRGE